MRPCRALQIVCVALIVWIAAALPAASATRHIVLLFDERPELPGLAALEADLVRTLRANSNDSIEIYREAMDLSRFGSPQYQRVLRDFLREKYLGKKIDVAVGILGPALDFLLNHGEAVFPGAAIVFCGIDRKELGERSLPPDVRGVLVKREFAPTLDLALGLHPQTRQVVVVGGTSEFDNRLLEMARAEFRSHENRLAFRYLTALSMEKLLEEVAGLPPHTIVLFTSMFRDGEAAPFVPHDVVRWVSAAASAPVYGFMDQYLGRGIVGGSLYSLAVHGTEAARLILEVLEGDDPSTPPLAEGQASKLFFDWRQMQRWGISAASLPRGSEIMFRDQSAWDRYHLEISAIIAAILLQAGLITWLLHERQYRHRAERAARETMAELTHMNRMAAAGELSATIAHEVKQPLTGIVASANAALRWLSNETPNLGRAKDALGNIVTAGHHANDVVTSVRSMFRKDTEEKGPIDVNTLIWSVLELVHADLRKHNIESHVRLADALSPVIANEVQLQQVILNLVMNAIEAMHWVEPRVLSIRSEAAADNRIRVTIEDTGNGVDPADIARVFKPLFTTKEQGMGMGLSICRSIIEGHDGQIWAVPRAARGSVFQFELPTGAAEQASKVLPEFAQAAAE